MPAQNGWRKGVTVGSENNRGAVDVFGKSEFPDSLASRFFPTPAFCAHAYFASRLYAFFSALKKKERDCEQITFTVLFLPRRFCFVPNTITWFCLISDIRVRVWLINPHRMRRANVLPVCLQQAPSKFASNKIHHDEHIIPLCESIA